jgi:hypothetical protein
LSKIFVVNVQFWNVYSKVVNANWHVNNFSHNRHLKVLVDIRLQLEEIR